MFYLHYALAKKGANLKINPQRPMTFGSIKQCIKRTYRNNLQHELDINLREQRRITLKDTPSETRRLAIVGFCLNIGHDILGKHLNHLGILPSPACILCDQQEDMDRQHLSKCPALGISTQLIATGKPELECCQSPNIHEFVFYLSCFHFVNE